VVAAWPAVALVPDPLQGRAAEIPNVKLSTDRADRRNKIVRQLARSDMVAISVRLVGERGRSSMRKPERVGRAWIAAILLTVVLGGIGFLLGWAVGLAGWAFGLAGGALGAGIGAVAGGFTPLLIERATRRKESIEAGRRATVLRREYGPARLLDPGLGVVPFSGRTAELTSLEDWCTAAQAGLVRLVSGGGGSGKTRLALELMRRMEAQGWLCLQVAEGMESEAVDAERSASPKARLLLVVDYAETRSDLESLIDQAARDEGQVRVLLLARHAGDWWERLQGGAAAVRDLVRDASVSVIELGDDLVPGIAAADEVRRALPFFATKLGLACPDISLVNIRGAVGAARSRPARSGAGSGAVGLSRNFRRASPGGCRSGHPRAVGS
jgi:hypothetical protein